MFYNVSPLDGTIDPPNRPLKNNSRLRGSGSLGQMSMGNKMGFMNDRI